MICRICGKKFKVLSPSHLKKHNMTIVEYKKKFNVTKTVDDCVGQKISKKNKGIINIGEKNGSKRKEVRNRISFSVKKRWEEGNYEKRVNGMKGLFRELHPNYKIEKHSALYLAEHKYKDFLSRYEDINHCRRCGSTGTINVHHIDEDRSNFLISNLVPLCVPCHADLHYKKRKLPFITVGKQFTFAAAHRLPNYKGSCSNLHGHEWRLQVDILKRVDKDTGMVIDFKDLKNIVEENIISVLDHGTINSFLENPTAENMLVWIWERLMFDGQLKGICKIHLWETETSSAELDTKGMLSIFSSNIESYFKGGELHSEGDYK